MAEVEDRLSLLPAVLGFCCCLSPKRRLRQPSARGDNGSYDECLFYFLILSFVLRETRMLLKSRNAVISEDKRHFFLTPAKHVFQAVTPRVIWTYVVKIILSCTFVAYDM